MNETGQMNDQSARLQQGAKDLYDQATETAQDVAERAVETAGSIGAAVRERPYTSLALAAGFAFVVGAMWKSGGRRPRSQWESLVARMPDVPVQEWLPRRWRW